MVSLVEEQLDLTMRQLQGVSSSITPCEIRSVCGRLGQMYHTMAQLLVMKTLEADGIASIGDYSLYFLSPQLTPL